MNTQDEFSDFIRHTIRAEIQKSLGNMKSPFVFVTFVAAEGVDADLSQVTLPGSGGTARFVPKLAHVTGLAAGQTLLCVKGPTVPLTIIGRCVGDITQASV